MASANFNTEILSSRYRKINTYNLDEVITKDFQSDKYSYTFNENPPRGVLINSNLLEIPEQIEFFLSITVSNGDKRNPIVAVASTVVTIDKQLNFDSERNIFFEKSNFSDLNTSTKNNWSQIISQRNNEPA